VLGAVAAWYGLRSQDEKNARVERVLSDTSARSASSERVGETPELSAATSGGARSGGQSAPTSGARGTGSGTAVPSGTSTSPSPPSPEKVAKLTIATPRGASWVQVRRGSINGPVTYEGTMAAGQKRTFSGARLYVTVGYPSAVLMELPRTKLAPDTSTTSSFLVTPTRISPA
jgi:hypothetical protein